MHNTDATCQHSKSIPVHIYVPEQKSFLYNELKDVIFIQPKMLIA